MFNSLELPQELQPHELAIHIGSLFDRWKSDFASWEAESTDVRNTIFASSIDTTTNQDNPFHNRTTIPKLAQIHDNLVANYDASLFPSMDWFIFESESKDALVSNKKKKIRTYLKSKIRQQKFRTKIRELLSDWIIYGNCFARTCYVREMLTDPNTDEKIQGYFGPKLIRISPADIRFDIRSTSFNESPKILRTLKSLGQLAKEIESSPESGFTLEMLDRIHERRNSLLPGGSVNSNYDLSKYQGLKADGFGSLQDYYSSNVVEVLEFYGDIYICKDKKLLANHHLVIIDRCEVVLQEPIKTLSGNAPLYHSVWRKRTDNLVGGSPLAPLLGMQHRLDKIENTKADVFDQIAYPTTVEKGDIEYYDGEGNLNGVRGTLGGFYRCDNDGDVQYLRPDATALNADFQIQNLMTTMEEMAGAPKNTMGIRTPGEKTRFEVQTLDNAASRIFQNKTSYFEEEFIEPILNDMLDSSRRNLDMTDLIRMTDDRSGVDTFIDITKDDLAASGRIYAVGSRYFARDALLVQNLTMLANSPLFSMVQADMDRHATSRLMESMLGLDQFSLFRENVGIEQQVETQRLINAGQQQLTQEDATPPEGDTDAPT